MRRRLSAAISVVAVDHADKTSDLADLHRGGALVQDAPAKSLMVAPKSATMMPTAS